MIANLARVALLVFVTTAMTARADIVWRIDFNGTTSATEDSVPHSGWVVSATSRTQTFANVDGGPESSNLTVTLNGSGGTTYNTYQRNMSGAATNLFRDGAQYNGINEGNYLNVGLSGLGPDQTYQVRLWYYDFQFSHTNVQSYFDITGGGNTFLGSLTNVTGGAAAPIDLYDSRYVLTATLAANSSGQLDIQLITGNSNQKINGLEVSHIVPEPSSIALLLLSGAIMRRRRRLYS